MTIPFYCLIAAAFLIYLPKLIAIRDIAKQHGRYDNRLPRAQQAKTEGRAARLLAAHYNGFEGFGVFAASVFVAHLGQASATVAAGLASAYVALRVLYVLLYVADIHLARSTVWTLMMLVCTGLFLAPVISPG